jgi:hypothetical protein
MPVQALAGGATAEAVGGSALASESASNIIAIAGVAAGTGIGVAALPSDMVVIGNVSLSLAPQGDIYVGDRIFLTAQIDVSYGEISSDGTGGKIRVELIEQGTGVLKIKESNATSPKDSFSLRYEGKTISHGTKLYYIKVTATGEEDLSYWPSGDTTVIRERESDTVSLEVKKPIVISTVLLTPSVSHGQVARALMKVSNLSESEAVILARLDSSWIDDGLRLRGKETDRRIIDHKEAHSGSHEGEAPWFFEPVMFFYHSHIIETANGVKYYDQIAPDDDETYDPIPITCTGGGDRRTGFIPNHWDGRNAREGEYAYACVTVDGNDQPLNCAAVFRDSFGNSIVAAQTNNRLQFQGRLTGRTGTITLTPDNSLWVPLNNSFLKELPDKFLFHYSPLPPIKGLVFIKDQGLPVAGCSVELKTANGETIYETVTNGDGKFTVHCNAKNIDGYGSLLLTAKLPWDISYNWVNPRVSKKITREEILSGQSHFLQADVQPPEGWVKISGKVQARDRKTRAVVPLQGIEVIVKDELDEIQDNAYTDDKGRYTTSMKPGRYFMEIANAAELGYRQALSKSFAARASKDDVDVWLVLPTPFVHYKSPEVLQVKLPANSLSDKLVLLNKGEIVKEYKAVKGAFYIVSKDLALLAETDMALYQNGLVGPTVRMEF